MKKNERFKHWIQRSLDEEINDIIFSQEMKEKVYRRVFKKKEGTGWLNRRISLSIAQLTIFAVVLILAVGFYGRAFFYISNNERAMACQENMNIIVRRGGAPFGAVHHLAKNTREGDEGRR